MPAILSEIIVFIFWNKPKEFPELGQNPSDNLKLRNNKNPLACNHNGHLGAVLRNWSEFTPSE